MESAKDALLALMAPTEKQSQDLKAQEGCSSEARDLLRSTLGITLKTRSKTADSLSQEVWRFVLFSEFVFDLPEPLPESLTGVPRAPGEARPLVEALCDELRSRTSTRDRYVEKAQAIEDELQLQQLCSGIRDFGYKATFLFEEQTFLRQAIDGVLSDNIDRARELLALQKDSVWRNRGDSQQRWTVIQNGAQPD